MKRVLIVEDHPLFREGLVQLLNLRLRDCQFIAVASAEEGLAEAAKPPAPDAIVLDLNLPGMDGLSALARFNESFRHIPVVVISGDDSPETVERAVAAGARAFIPKSLPGAGIVQGIEHALNGRVGTFDGTHFVSEAPPSEGGALPDGLSLRQMEVLALICEGKSNKQIARELGIVERTVKSHVTAIFGALSVINRTQAAMVAERLGLVTRAAR
jgi:two-component system, NarL family, nitrate/nitrite response regulator NarL